MDYDRPAPRAVAAATGSRNARMRPIVILIGGILLTTANLADAANSEPLAPAPIAKALIPLAEPDLMEAAFREGLSFYQSGDYAAAARAWLAPAEHGHAGAEFSLGVAYATGNGVPKNLNDAIRWWNEAARHGHPTAQLNLGLLYWRGVGVEKDLSKARAWWQRAADGGDAVAQFHLGAMAATGDGMPIDYDEAVRWWRLSAAQGYEQAIKGLEILRSHGLVAETTAY